MNMKVIEYFSSDNKKHWLSQIAKCDWNGGKRLYKLLQDGNLQKNTGEGTLVLLLVDGDNLVSFCTFAPLDDIQPTKLTPWIGFVYTFPNYRGRHCAGQLFEWCESVAAIMEKEYIYISTNHVGLYEKYGYEFWKSMKDIHGEDSRIYRKALQIPCAKTKIRKENGSKWKNEVVAAAKKDLDMSAYCGFSCRHCFLGEWCGGCRSYFNCCSYATLHEKHVCPNVNCCKEKGIDGCYECDEIMDCQKGFYSLGKDGNAAKSQALFIKKYGKEEFFKVHDNLHKKYDFKKTQEVLGYDVFAGLKIMEENMNRTK